MVVGSGEDAEAEFPSFSDGDLSRGRSGPGPDLQQEHTINRMPCMDRPTPQMRPMAAGPMINIVSPDVQDDAKEEGSACCDREEGEEEEEEGQAPPCWHEVVANIVTNPCTGG